LRIFCSGSENAPTVRTGPRTNETQQATTNTGILHYVQDDDVKQTTATATADPYGMTNNLHHLKMPYARRHENGVEVGLHAVV
jgi:hypothetical protein